MTYRGYIEDGKVILDAPAALPDGTEVRVHPQARSKERRTTNGRHTANRRAAAMTVSRRLLRYAGCIKDLPSDASRNVDHYLYGHPKR